MPRPANKHSHTRRAALRKLWLATGIIGALLLVVVLFVVIGSAAPGAFQNNKIVKIPAGTALGEAASLLREQGVIRSATMYKIYAVLLGGSGGLKTGDYLFTSPESALRVAERTVSGEGGFPTIKVSIPEGSNTSQMAKIFGKAIPGFDQASFMAEAKPREGYLFPDTYYFTAADDPVSVIKAMSDNFNDKERSISRYIADSKRTPDDIIIMASIVEKEATSSSDRRIIAGILWKRIDTGMPLQVDPPFFYFLGKTTALVSADLKIDSPYNTYLHRGLPPTPIDSPGLDAIKDAASPTASSYWFYISGDDGTMHYAATFAGHNANIQDYLN